MPAAQKRQRRVSIVAIMLSVSLVLTACIIFYAYALFDRYQGFAGDMLAANGDVLELTYVRDHLEAMDAPNTCATNARNICWPSSASRP